MDITDNKYIKYVFSDLAKVPGRRYSSMLHKKVYLDTRMPRQDKDRIETAIQLLKMYGFVEEKDGSTQVMNFVLATEDKGNKVIEYGKRVEIAVDLLEWIPYEEDRKNHGRLLYELTGDKDSFFPANEDSVKTAIKAAGIDVPQEMTSRIDLYEYVMQETDKSAYEMFLKVLSENIEQQDVDSSNVQMPTPMSSPVVTNVNITNPIIIENMSDSKIKTTDKSNTTNVIVNGSDNQIVTNSRNTHINNTQNPKPKQHWLQILYWVVGIALALIGVYKFFIE